MKSCVGIVLCLGLVSASGVTVEPPVYEKYDGRRGPSALDGERVGEAIDHLANTGESDAADDALLSLFSRDIEEYPPVPVPDPVPPISDNDAPFTESDMSSTEDAGRPSPGKDKQSSDGTPGQPPAADRATPFDM